jgi:hypothetical protein
MGEALGEHGPVLHRDHGDEQEREEAEDLADRDATGESGESSRRAVGELYRCHVLKGSPHRANSGLRMRRRRLTCGKRLGRKRHRSLCAGESGPLSGAEERALTSMMLEVLRSLP